jgi:hypothetical protein
MNEHQGALRRAARKALAGQGFAGIAPVAGSGGARLDCMKDGAPVLALVRTSANRAVGWMRDEAGDWRGLAEAGLVVVAALDDEARPTRAEVYGFAPAVLRAAFDDMLKVQLARLPELARTAPVFVHLDDRKPGAPPGVKARALWRVVVPLAGAPAGAAAPAAAPDKAGFVARVREQFARLMGVPVDKVTVEFKVSV